MVTRIVIVSDTHCREWDEVHPDIRREVAEADIAIHDATQIIGYFNYINRIADALGVEVDTFIRPWEQGPR